MERRVFLCGVTALLSFASLMIWSCGAFSGTDTTNSDDASTGDAPSLQFDGNATNDAGNRSDAGDSGRSLDASLRQADATPFCPSYEPAPIYCADFDEADASAYGFYSDGGLSGYFPNPGDAASAYTIDKSSSVSPPNEVTFTTTAGVATDKNGRASAVFLGSYEIDTSATLSFSVYIDTIDPTSPMTLTDVNFGEYDVAIVVGGGQQAQLQELDANGNLVASHDVGAALSPGTWVDVVLVVDFDMGTVAATIAGVAHSFTGTQMQSGEAVFSYGIVYYDSKTVAASTVHFDNVVFNRD